MEGRPWKRSRVSDLNNFFRLVARLWTINSEADTNWFIRKSTKLDTQWVTDFFTDPRESANIPLWEHANWTPPMTGSNARKGTMRKPLSTFAWPWTCGRAFCKPLPACFVRFLLFFFCKHLCFIMFYWLFFWGEAIARGLALYYAPVLSRAIYELGDIF